MKRITILLLLLTTLTTCSSRKILSLPPSGDFLPEATLHYKIYTPTELWGILESEYTVTYNAGHVRIDEKKLVDSITVAGTHIFDKQSAEVLMLINDIDGSYFLYHTPEELMWAASLGEDADTVITDEFKTIAGYSCRKSILKVDDYTAVSWTTDKIQPGVLYPGTPLAFKDVALEYELKLGDKVEHRYELKGLVMGGVDHRNFEHLIPDDYHQVVPAAVFSLHRNWEEQYEENTFK